MATTKRAAALLGAVLTSALPGATMAQTAEVGVLRAIAGEEPVPASGPIAVVAEDFDDNAMAIQTQIEQALTERGFTIRFDAPLLLTFGQQRDHDVSPIPSGAIDSGMQEEMAESENEADTPGVDFGEQGPVGDAPQMPDVVVEYHFGGGNAVRAPTRYNLDFIVGNSGAPPLWQGSMTADLPTPDPVEAARIMTPPLIAHLGQTVPARRVVLKQP